MSLSIHADRSQSPISGVSGGVGATYTDWLAVRISDIVPAARNVQWPKA